MFANLLVVDQPIGTGLSPNRHNSEIIDLPHSIHRVATDLLDLLASFIRKYPQFYQRKIYFVANDYSFHVVAHIFKDKLINNKLGLNIGGFSFINPLIDGALQYKTTVKSASQRDLLSSPIKFITSQLGSYICRIFQMLGLKNSAHFSCKITQKIVEGMNYTNLKSHNFTQFLDPKVEHIFTTFMTKEINKTPASYKFSRCSSEVAEALRTDILADYSSQLGLILDSKLPVFIIFGENDLWNNQFILSNILTNSKWKYYGLISKSSWKDWILDNVVTANYIKIDNLTLIRILNAGQYPFIKNRKLAFDIIANLLLFA